MKNFLITIWVFALLFYSTATCFAELASMPALDAKEQIIQEQLHETVSMLTSLLEVQRSLEQEIEASRKKLEDSSSDAEKESLQRDIEHLDKQLSETSNDFERIATGIEPALFADKKPETFSWKDELSSLAEPVIKELQRFTIRARQKTRLKDSVIELEKLVVVARKAVQHLEEVLEEESLKPVHNAVKLLLPEYANIEKRLQNKLELSKLELSTLESQEVSFVETTHQSIRIFFKERGVYLLVAASTFVSILILFKLLYNLSFFILAKIKKQERTRSFQLRLFDILFRSSSIVFAIIGLFFVLYMAEDWFLLSMAIIFFMGIIWTVRQGLPRLWQQGRLMLNIGSVRENERLTFNGVPWKVTSINVFCYLENPAMGVKLRIPIEEMTGLVSRPYKNEEPWFPCQKGDWVVVGTASRGRVVSLSHEQVELVQRGGKRVFYPTETFLQACPVNLSRNFRVRVPFGISYSLQDQATSVIPEKLKDYLQLRIKEHYQEQCLNLQVEFLQANSSSLDLIILADLSGKAADISKRIERAIHKWCVDCCTENGWEIPFPQLTVHKAE